MDLNQRPSACRADALATELWSQNGGLSLNRTEFLRSSGECVHQLHQQSVMECMIGVEPTYT